MTATLRRRLFVTLIATSISVILCTLGFHPTATSLDSIAAIWPGAILHSVGAILFGAWGILAAVLAGIIVDILKVGTFHVIFGFAIPDFLQALIPALYYRRLIARHGFSAETFRFVPFLFFATLIPNFVGALVGTFIFHLNSAADIPYWFPFLRWLTANIPITLVLGWPLFRTLGPVLAEEGFAVRGWWR